MFTKWAVQDHLSYEIGSRGMHTVCRFARMCVGRSGLNGDLVLCGAADLRLTMGVWFHTFSAGSCPRSITKHRPWSSTC